MIEFIIAIFILIVLLFVTNLLKKKRCDKKLAFIVVLGDIGRSPRMNYHSLSLVKIGYNVIIIGYKENKQLKEIENNSNIQITPLNTFPKFLQIGPSILQYGLKALYLSLSLVIALFQQKYIPNFVLVQNPPSIPTLVLVYFYARVVKTKFIIDWHNYGFTILALKKGTKNLLVKLCKRMELYFGKRSDLNFCVTDAMKSDLMSFKIRAITLHDKAHERFKKLDLKEKNQFYLKLADYYKIENLRHEEGNTIFTKSIDGDIKLRAERPAILVSSSSWTEDEDFQLLIEAFEIYQNSSIKTDIICFLTGKGPLKEYYQKAFKEKQFSNIKIYFIWLDPSDYPLLLGSADLGLCFHKSSSNLDLPMKVVDMFGCKLPTCAYNFTCISELVKDDENGLLFTTAQELANHLLSLLPTLDKKESRLQVYKKNLEDFSYWSEEWERCMKPAITSF